MLYQPITAYHKYIHIIHIARYGLKDDKFSLVYTKTYNWVFVSLL